MELRHLRYFVAVAEEQNISRAAIRLRISQPPLSRQIRDLEREMGVKLFERSARAVRLTEAGRIFLLEARNALRRADEAIELMEFVSRGKRGQVRVGYAASPSAELLPRILRKLQHTHPEVRVDLREMSTLAIQSGLRDKSLDCGLTVPISPHDFSGLAVHVFQTLSIQVAMHKRHRFTRLQAVPIAKVAHEPLVAYTPEEYPEYHVGLRRILEPYNPYPKIVEEYPSIMSLVAGIEATRGVALLFESVSSLAGPRIAMRPMIPAPPRLPFALTHRKERLAPATAAFVAAAKTVNRDET